MIVRSKKIAFFMCFLSVFGVAGCGSKVSVDMKSLSATEPGNTEDQLKLPEVGDAAGQDVPSTKTSQELRWEDLPKASDAAPVTEPTGEAIRQSINGEFARWWRIFSESLKPELEAAIDKAIEDGLKDIENVQLQMIHPPQFAISGSPGLTDWSHERWRARIPLEGHHQISVKVDVVLTQRIAGRDVDIPQTFTIIIRRLLVDQFMEFDHRDASHIKLVSATKPSLSFKIDIEGEGLVGGFLGRVVEVIVQGTLPAALQAITLRLMEDLSNLGEGSQNIIGEGGPLLSNPSGPLGISQWIENMEKSIADHHLPHGTLMKLLMDNEDGGSWSEHFMNHGAPKGQVRAYEGIMDSPIFTGIYLASQVYRFVVTKDEKVLDNVRKAIGGFAKLFDVNSDGLMARLAVPKNSALGREILAKERAFRERVIDGQTWISFQGKAAGVTRDQNLGALFGLSIAYEFLGQNYPDIAAECKRLLTMQLEFILKNDWFLLGDDGFPTFWSPLSIQKYSYLAVNNYINNGKYQAELDKIRNSAPAIWINAWFGVQEVVAKYYKFNLAYMSLYPILHFERDALIRQSAQKAHSLYDRQLGHHLNPYFDLMRVDFGSVPKNLIAGNIRGSLDSFIKRCYRGSACKAVDTSHIEFVEVEMSDGSKETISKFPLEPYYRKYGALFEWERNPWKVADYPGDQGGRSVEAPGIAISFPYWFGKYLGVMEERD